MSCIGDCSPQVDNEIIGESERLQVRVVDRFGEVHRVGFVAAQIPNLNSEFVVIDAEERVEQDVDGINSTLRYVVVLKIDDSRLDIANNATSIKLTSSSMAAFPFALNRNVSFPLPKPFLLVTLWPPRGAIVWNPLFIGSTRRIVKVVPKKTWLIETVIVVQQ